MLTFFRQGEVLKISEEDCGSFEVQIVTKLNDLGNIYVLENYDLQVLVSSTSSSVIFYKFMKKKSKWKEYYRIDEVRGQIYYRSQTLQL